MRGILPGSQEMQPGQHLTGIYSSHLNSRVKAPIGDIPVPVGDPFGLSHPVPLQPLSVALRGINSYVMRLSISIQIQAEGPAIPEDNRPSLHLADQTLQILGASLITFSCSIAVIASVLSEAFCRRQLQTAAAWYITSARNPGRRVNLRHPR